MVNVNRVLFGGYLVADPESRQVGNGTVCHFTVANNRKWTSRDGQAKEEATFVDCEAWAKVGEIAQNYLKKGRPVLVEGRLKLDKWTTPEGQKRQKLKVSVDAVQFLDGHGGGGEGHAEGAPAGVSSQAQAPAGPTYNADEPF
jgi:single-strand DNA-binding protein